MKTYKVYKTRNGAFRAWEKLEPVDGYKDQCLKDAAEKERRREESFQRCDTDGFVSQWSAGVMADRDRREHDRKSHGGAFVFRVLVFKGSKTVASTKLFTFDDRFSYGSTSKWLVDGKWITDYKRLGNFHKLGLDVAWIVAPSYIDSSDPLDRRAPSYGLSGACNVSYRNLLDRDAAKINI